MATVVRPLDREDTTAATADRSRGLGIALASFSLSTAVGDLLGGSLSENHRDIACYICSGVMLSALASLHVLGWEETAPRRRRKKAADSEGGRVSEDPSSPKRYNPFSILEVFLESR